MDVASVASLYNAIGGHSVIGVTPLMSSDKQVRVTLSMTATSIQADVGASKEAG